MRILRNELFKIDDMNFLKPVIVGTFALASLTVSAQVEVAPATSVETASVTPEAAAELRSRKQLETLTPELGLTPEQVEQIHALNVKVEAKIYAIRTNTEMDAARKQEFIQGNRGDQNRVMQTILTPEQFAKYESITIKETPQRVERQQLQIQDVEK
jgi:hypothetical protein